MPQVILLPRNPKGSEMTLSNQVKQALDNATANLREALAFAARTEHPVTISTLTDTLVRLESIESIEEIMHKFGKEHDIPTNFG
jgi:DNA repair photolyase